MAGNISPHMQGSPALQFVVSQGWNWRNVTDDKIEVEICPYCKKDKFHFSMQVHGSTTETKNRDGLHGCVRCGKTGRLYDLKQHLGITVPDVESRKDWAGGEKKIEELPDIEACHQALLEDDDAMDYLMNGRGFSRDIITKQKLGIVAKRYFRETGEVKALIYPYLVNGNCVFVHYRTLPDMANPGKVPKAFSSPKGWDAPLYNGEVLREGLKDVVMVEGEANCIAAMDKGFVNVCGVPGANVKKAEWIETLDKLECLEKIYVAYDKDKVGQKAAQTIAARIGIERCWKLTLPDFEVVTENGEKRKGKDLNEWFTQGGGTAEAFEKLKETAVLFDVDGVSNSKDAVQEFLDELLGKGVEPKYRSQWPGLNKLVGFDDGDVIDVLAAEKVGKTTWAMNLVEHMVNTYGDDGIIICLEMTRAKLARKWIAHKAGVADNIPTTVEEAHSLKDAFLKAIPTVQDIAANRDGDLYFCMPKYKTTEDIYQLIRDCIRRYGVKWIVLDNLQLIADTTPSGNKGRTTHLSEISKATSRIAKEYGICMVRILQPHRVGEGQIVTSDNTDGSSQIAKDCDCNITLHRNKVGSMKANDVDMLAGTDQIQSFDSKTLCTVGLSRYSSGGRTWLLCDGPRSTFTEMSVEQLTLAQAEINKDKGFAASISALASAVNATPADGPDPAADIVI